MKEFDLIENYFSKYASKRKDVLLGIGDDCALLKVPEHQVLAVTIDTLVEGVHFFNNTPAEFIGYKALAVSLSDLAAMGAKPAWVTLALTLSQVDESWLENFCKGFYALIERFSLQLVGGNISSGALSITTQLHGFLPEGKALRRDGAKIGDLIYVTGCLGDAGLALQLVKRAGGKINHNTPVDLLQRLYHPQPRIKEGMSLLEIANSAIDISDGLAADLGHILERSKVGAMICVDELPLSLWLRQKTSLSEAINLALSAGDDYELCFTIDPKFRANLEEIAANFECKITEIGIITRELGLKIKHKNGQVCGLVGKGYEHVWC